MKIFPKPAMGSAFFVPKTGDSSHCMIRFCVYNSDTLVFNPSIHCWERWYDMAVLFKEFCRPAFSGNADELKRKVVKFCNTDIKGFRVISISEAKGMTDDFYRITVWYDDNSERFEQLMAETHIQDAIE
jgi:hypothetical protein